MRAKAALALLLAAPALAAGLAVEPCFRAAPFRASSLPLPLSPRAARGPRTCGPAMGAGQPEETPRGSELQRRLRGGAGKAAGASRLLLPSAIAALFLTAVGADGAATVGAAVQVNCVPGAAAFFNGIRTPAALVAGAALGNLWTTFGDKGNPQHARMQAIYWILLCLSVVLQFSTVFYATASDVRLMYGSYKSALAKDTMSFLVREMELPYVAVRLHFFLGIATFLTGLAIRAWVTFPPNIARAAALLLVGMVANMFVMVGTGPIAFVKGLLFRYLYLFVQDCVTKPIGLLTLLLYGGSLVFAVRGLLLAGESGDGFMGIKLPSRSPSKSSLFGVFGGKDKKGGRGQKKDS